MLTLISNRGGRVTGTASAWGDGRCLSVSLLMVVGITLCVRHSAVMAQESSDTDPLSAETVASEADTQDASGAEDGELVKRRRENLVSILLILLAGVVILGIALIAGTMIWGAKLRRSARVPEREPTRQNELWYFRRPPPSVKDETREESDP